MPDYLDFYVSDIRFKTISLVKYQQYIECLVLQTIILRSKHVQGLALRFFYIFGPEKLLYSAHCRYLLLLKRNEALVGFLNFVKYSPLFRYYRFCFSEIICKLFDVIYHIFSMTKNFVIKLLVIMFSIHLMFPVKCVPYSITLFYFC